MLKGTIVDVAGEMELDGGRLGRRAVKCSGQTSNSIAKGWGVSCFLSQAAQPPYGTKEFTKRSQYHGTSPSSSGSTVGVS